MANSPQVMQSEQSLCMSATCAGGQPQQGALGTLLQGGPLWTSRAVATPVNMSVAAAMAPRSTSSATGIFCVVISSTYDQRPSMFKGAIHRRTHVPSAASDRGVTAGRLCIQVEGRWLLQGQGVGDRAVAAVGSKSLEATRC
jgi:hypothetical protein